MSTNIGHPFPSLFTSSFDSLVAMIHLLIFFIGTTLIYSLRLHRIVPEVATLPPSRY
jgi:hypothetical protein